MKENTLNGPVEYSRFFMNFKFTRFLERFAPIFYLNCEYGLFMDIFKQKQKYIISCKNFVVRGFHKKDSRIFKIFKILQNLKKI